MANHRYWRLYIETDQASDSNFPAFADISFASSLGGANLIPTSGVGASASSVYSTPTYDAAMGCDGDPATLWSALSAAPQWWSYDFGVSNAYSIVEVKITGRNDGFFNTGPGPSYLQYSDDNVTWFNEFAINPTAWTSGATQTFDPPTQFEVSKLTSYALMTQQGQHVTKLTSYAVFLPYVDPDAHARVTQATVSTLLLNSTFPEYHNGILIWYDNFDEYASNAIVSTPWFDYFHITGPDAPPYTSDPLNVDEPAAVSYPNSFLIGKDGGGPDAHRLLVDSHDVAYQVRQGFFDCYVYFTDPSCGDCGWVDGLIGFENANSAIAGIQFGYSVLRDHVAGYVWVTPFFGGNSAGNIDQMFLVSSDQWHHVRFTILLSTTSNGYASLVIDGLDVWTFSGITIPAITENGSIYVDGFGVAGQEVGGQPPAEAYIDNLGVYYIPDSRVSQSSLGVLLTVPPPSPPYRVSQTELGVLIPQPFNPPRLTRRQARVIM